MRNLLIVTQKVDEEDDLLGFFVDWLREFSKHFDNVFVITLAKGSYNLPGNVSVYSLGKERGTSKVNRLIIFYKLLFTLVPKSSGIFAHMSPIFVVASWPAAFLFRKKIILWYLHRSVTSRLKLAEKLSYKIVTAAKESLKFESNKIVEVGHGIRSEIFRTERNWTHGKMRIVSVGRISPIKNYETLIEAGVILKKRGSDVEINIVGKPVMGGDSEYKESLEALVAELRADNVKFSGFVAHDRIADVYRNSDIFVGALPSGGIDKVMLEAMASGCIALTSNDVFKRYFDNYSEDLIFGHGDANDLADKLESIINFTPKQKEEISHFLVSSVSEHHQLKNVITTISALI